MSESIFYLVGILQKLPCMVALFRISNCPYTVQIHRIYVFKNQTNRRLEKSENSLTDDMQYVINDSDMIFDVISVNLFRVL